MTRVVRVCLDAETAGIVKRVMIERGLTTMSAAARSLVLTAESQRAQREIGVRIGVDQAAPPPPPFLRLAGGGDDLCSEGPVLGVGGQRAGSRMAPGV